jgi:outer membrane immunogenic protein
MKKLALSLAIVATNAATAAAADLDAYPVKATTIIAPQHVWSGFYYGANAGYGTSRNCLDLVAPSPLIGAEGCQNASGAAAGGQFGYRMQTDGWVLGFEAQVDWANLRSSRVSDTLFFNIPGDATNRTRIDAFGLLTGQVGYAFRDVLFYVKGGAAFTTGRYDDFAAGVATPALTGAETPVGGTAGIGLEYGFAPNLSFGVVYDHLFMGTKSVAFTALTPIGGAVVTDRIRQDADIISARINYTFGGPSIGKY